MRKWFLRYEFDDIRKRNTNKLSYKSRVLAGKFSTTDAYTRKRVYMMNKKWKFINGLWSFNYIIIYYL